MRLRGIINDPRLGTFGYMATAPLRAFDIWIYFASSKFLLGTVAMLSGGRCELRLNAALNLGERTFGPCDQLDESVSQALTYVRTKFDPCARGGAA